MQVELIRHESPAGPYWYHPDHPLCDEGKVLWVHPEECKMCGGLGTLIEGELGAQYQVSCEQCNGLGLIDIEYNENN